MHIKWSDELSLGIERIDSEHRHLINLSNSLISSTQSKNKDELTKCFHRLREYTVFHFKNEEQYLEEIGYPELEKHKTEHRLLKLEVKEFQHKAYRNESLKPKDVFQFIRHWLIEHVLNMDMKYKTYTISEPSEKA